MRTRCFILILHLLFFFSDSYSQKIKEFYVATTGSDSNPGSLQRPFRSIEKAKAAVRSFKMKNLQQSRKISVFIRGGVYFLKEPLIFIPEDGGDRNLEVEYLGYKDEKVTISGGTTLPKKWIRSNVSTDEWYLKLEGIDRKEIQVKFRQLFRNGQRINRASSQIFFTEGPLSQYKSKIRKFDSALRSELKSNGFDAFSTFTYSGVDLDNLKDYKNAEIIVYHSWEASWHNLSRIDSKSKSVYLSNPFRYPIGYFSDNLRYRIENSRDFFRTPGSWYLDYENDVLWYKSLQNDNPNNDTFIVPILDTLISLRGNEKAGRYVMNVSFSKIQFSHTSYPWGVTYLGKNDQRKFIEKYPWLDFTQGFTSPQVAPDCGAAVTLSASKYCTFDSCYFTGIGNYGVLIGEYCTYNKIKRSTFKDAGGGGILIGFNKNPIQFKLPLSMSPSYNIVENCSISKCGIIHPAAVGIAIMQANNNSLKNNEIFDLPYSGISLGWTFGFHKNYTFSNKIIYNNIYNAMQELADGGAIYTLGPQAGTIIRGNLIHDVKRNKYAVGATSNGIFFDEGSSEMLVDSNVVYSVAQKDYKFNQTDSLKIKWGRNYFERSVKNRDLLSPVQKRAGIRK